MNRLGRIFERSQRWLRLRRQDIAWRATRPEFKARLESLLNDHHWVFLVGCNNSGTTLIHDVLAASGDFSYMQHEGQRYTSAIRIAQRRGHERVWTEYLQDLRLTDQDPLDQADRLVFDWMSELEQPVKQRIIEKTTANAVRMTWLNRVFPNAYFVGVIRNGYAVSEGIKRKGKKSIDRAAKHWSRVNEIMLDDARHVRRFLPIRYEDFVSSGSDSLMRLSEFLDLPLSSLQNGFQNINAGLSSGTGIRNMNSKSFDRLTPEEIASIERNATEMLARFEYKLDASGLASAD